MTFPITWETNGTVIFFKRERRRNEQGEGQRGRERIFSRLYAQHGAQCGAPSPDPGIMT